MVSVGADSRRVEFWRKQVCLSEQVKVDAHLEFLFFTKWLRTLESSGLNNPSVPLSAGRIFWFSRSRTNQPSTSQGTTSRTRWDWGTDVIISCVHWPSPWQECEVIVDDWNLVSLCNWEKTLSDEMRVCICDRLRSLSQVQLCFLNGNHYDSVYPISHIKSAALCQCECSRSDSSQQGRSFTYWRH